MPCPCGTTTASPGLNVGPGRDPLVAADELGRPVAIVRMGGRVPDQGADPNFYFGSPAWVAYPPRTALESKPVREAARARVGRARGEEALAMDQASNKQTSTRAWRWAIIVLGTLVLCSCQGPAAHGPNQAAAPGNAVAQGPYAGIPPQAYTGVPPGEPCPLGPPGMEAGVPLPYTGAGPWVPPGIVPPWPADEYLRDGGNAGPPIPWAATGSCSGWKWKTPWPATTRSTAARWSNLATRWTSTARASALCGRWSTSRWTRQRTNRATGVISR